ncbi:hypothetical protein [Motiliproteus sp. SC1-56]|uniref:hypothetical protein n=1 Tax=Motiliproteus sp. SC1-56 TaxID=2799565 RepID=UPI001A8D562C|nr:hypothetical protein [Motiliproteus sp. SC1-56]
MTPEEAIKKLDAILRPEYQDIIFHPSGICSRTLQIPFKGSGGLQYMLTLFIEVAMAPTTGVATEIIATHPPKHAWRCTPEELEKGGDRIRALFDLITDLGNEYLTRERQTLKVLNNQDLGRQLARLSQANGGDKGSEGGDQFTLKKGVTQIKVKIVEDKTPSTHAAVAVNITGVENKNLLSALKLLLQQASG